MTVQVMPPDVPTLLSYCVCRSGDHAESGRLSVWLHGGGEGQPAVVRLHPRLRQLAGQPRALRPQDPRRQAALQGSLL